MSTTQPAVAMPAPRLVGNTFVHPVVDYLIIGGGLSLIVAMVVWWKADLTQAMSYAWLPAFILISNSAHFAASTVRLYTKPNASRDYPILTGALPAIFLIVASVGVLLPVLLGRHLQALYLTWSPFHYAAQAYGLAVMYCYRSKCQLSVAEKWLLWLICMLPFLRSFFGAPNSGLGWFVSRETLLPHPLLMTSLHYLTVSLTALTFIIPVLYFLRLLTSKTSPMPLISLLIVLTNGVWWIALDYLNAFVWATVFHGIQYLVIVIIFHVKDQLRQPENKRSAAYHAAWFYGTAVLLGYGLFYCWPQFYVLMGFGLAESMLLVIAVINIHHFVVDAFIWRLHKDRNYQNVVDSAAVTQLPQPAPLTVGLS